MSLPFVVQQSLRRISSSNIMSSAPALDISTSDPDVEKVADDGQIDAAVDFSGQSLSFSTSDPHAAPSPTLESPQIPLSVSIESKQTPVPCTPALQDEEAKEDEGVVLWSRLKAYEAEEARAVNRHLMLLARHTPQQSSPAEAAPKLHEKFNPEGDLLFTGRYILRFLEEEERLRREQLNWTRSKDSITTTTTYGAKESAYDSERSPPSSSSSFPSSSSSSLSSSDPALRHQHARGYDEEEAEEDDEFESSSSPLGNGPSFAHVRSGISSVGSALRKRMQFPKVMSLASKKRSQQRRDNKGKEAAASMSSSSFSSSSEPWLYGEALRPHHRHHPNYLPIVDVMDESAMVGFGGGVGGGEPLPSVSTGMSPSEMAEIERMGALRMDRHHRSGGANARLASGLGVVRGTSAAEQMADEDGFPFAAGWMSRSTSTSPPQRPRLNMAAHVAPFGNHPASTMASSSGEFEKLWGRDYSPFSDHAFSQGNDATNGRSTEFVEEDDDGDELPPLIDIDPSA